MTFENGEITISPYTLYWIQMPAVIGEPDRIELLKRNVFIIECQYGLNDYSKLLEKKDECVAFFFNLDKILFDLKKGTEYEIGKRIAKFISRFAPDKTVIHTTVIDPAMREIFQLEGLIYLEKNFNDKEQTVETIIDLLKPLFSNENRIKRTDIRLLLYPGMKFKTEISNIDRTITKNGFLKDISLSGIGIKFDNEADLDSFSLKDKVQLRIFTHNSIFKIPIGILTRKTPHVKELGVSFIITDTNMIREETSNFIVKMIYKWIKAVILKHGKI